MTLLIGFIEDATVNKRRKTTKLILIVICILITIELLALAWLGLSIGRYKNFWIKKANEPGEIVYLALGDSTAQGIGATSPERGYVGLIAKRLEKKLNKKVQIINLSVTGAKIEDYLSDQAPKIKDVQADYVTIEIGAKDVTNFNPDNFRLDFKKVLESLPDGAFVSNMPVFNSRPGVTKNSRQASKIVEEELANFPALIFFDLEKQTKENRSIFGFAPDLFHPNNLSYKNWADAFWLKIDK